MHQECHQQPSRRYRTEKDFRNPDQLHVTWYSEYRIRQNGEHTLTARIAPPVTAGLSVRCFGPNIGASIWRDPPS